jgi:undecaprenyl-diphosphatase
VNIDARMTQPDKKDVTEPVKRALEDALAEVDSPEKAAQVVRELEQEIQGKTAGDVMPAQPTTPAQAAQGVAQADAAAPPETTTKDVLLETARAVVSTDERGRQAISDAATDVMNPQQHGTPVPDSRRDMLREAVLNRLKPLDKLDARLFLAINHLPHTRLSNAFFYVFTFAFTVGAAWYALMAMAFLHDRREGMRLIRGTAVPLAIAGGLVELPIKAFFKRRRPFISIIQAIVIGRKPGSWSFPSGHSAVAFAGAWLFSQKMPKHTRLFYLVAGLVGFSRVYLGNHYPGDVAIGSLLGTIFAMLARWVIRLFFYKR